MDVKIEGNPGSGNSYYEYHINKVETFAPNATTVINNYYSDRKPAQATLSKAEENAVLIQRQHEILDYVAVLSPLSLLNGRTVTKVRGVRYLPCLKWQPPFTSRASRRTPLSTATSWQTFFI